MGKRNIKYLVDLGNKTVIRRESQLRRYYAKHINHSQYTTFEKWLGYKWKCADITAII